MSSFWMRWVSVRTGSTGWLRNCVSPGCWRAPARSSSASCRIVTSPEGIPTLVGYRSEHISADLDLVVVGNAISRGNPELEEVLDRKIRYCSLPEAIREHFLWGARSIVVAGTHGKTTTTAMIGWLLTHGGVDPSVLVGGIVRNFGEQGSSYRLGLGRDFVIGGDEYH